MRFSKTAWMILFAFLCGWLIASCCRGNDLQAAVEDRAKFPQPEWTNLYYFSLSQIPEEQRQACVVSLNYVCCATSFEMHVEQTLPVRVTETLLRIDTRSLGWNSNTLRKVLAQTPYKRYAVPENQPFLVNHPGWFVVACSDSSESTAYNELLFSAANIKRADFLKAFRTNEDPQYLFSRIEGQSGVSVAGRRWILNFPNAIRTDVWGTIDSFRIENETDPLGNLDYVIDNEWKQKPKHDGEEWIAGIPKFSSATNTYGRVQAYALFDSGGDSVAEAPGRLVVDRTMFRGHGVITYPAGCISCHASGLNPLSVDAFKNYTAKATAYTQDYEKAQALNQSLLAPIESTIARANQEYMAGIQMITGLEPKEFSQKYVSFINWYDQPLNLDQAARELYSTANDVKLAIAYRQTQYNDLEAGLALLAGGGTIPRSLWEDLYLKAAIILGDWNERQ